MPLVYSFLGAFFNLKVALILLLFVVGIPMLFIAGYLWWARRL